MISLAAIGFASLFVLLPVASAHDCNASGTVSWDRNHNQVCPSSEPTSPDAPADNPIPRLGCLPTGHFCTSVFQ